MQKWTRRQILHSSLAAGGLAASGFGLRRLLSGDESGLIPVHASGPSTQRGHRIRDGFVFPDPTEFNSSDVLIVGGGMAGLSAAWRLQKKGGTRFQVFELEDEVGGNSRSGVNSVSPYPWGAHYVTLPNDEAEFVHELYAELGITQGSRRGRRIYNEYYLCQAPQERLFQSHKWHEGLLPKVGLSAEDDKQAQDFFAHIEILRHQKGRDGKFAFAIPLELSSQDSKFLAWDQLTMQDYMHKMGWTSVPLHWYVNYCCRDDYGTPHAQVSAWAGLHYFCSRRGRADGVEASAVLTWPEGNGWLVNRLREKLQGSIKTGSMAIKVESTGSGVTVDFWQEKSHTVSRWQGQYLILAIPRFVAARLVPQKISLPSYSPWLVANLTLSRLPKQNLGAPLSWDNVFYQSPSLGYVVATHQSPQIHTGASVWTYYRPLDHLPPAEARREALTRSPEFWREQILEELAQAHPEIRDCVKQVELWTWGHAMARPVPGFLWGSERQKMLASVGRIHFAHSDMSGISLFEEANYRGVKAANEVLRHGIV